MLKVVVKKCETCKHEWVTRVARPLKCPRCWRPIREKE